VLQTQQPLVNAFVDRTTSRFHLNIITILSQRSLVATLASPWIANAHRSKSSTKTCLASDRGSDSAGTVPGIFRNLIANPFCGRCAVTAEPYHFVRRAPDQQSIEQTNELSARRTDPSRRLPSGMIVEECLPPWDGGPRRPAIYFGQLVCPISDPSLSNSPWIRRRSPSGLQCSSRWISLRIRDTLGRPPRRFDFLSANTL